MQCIKDDWRTALNNVLMQCVKDDWRTALNNVLLQCIKDDCRKGSLIFEGNWPILQIITVIYSCIFYRVWCHLAGQCMSVAMPRAYKVEGKEKYIWRTLAIKASSDWALEFTFSHLADAFVQSDVQGREYSSYEQ